jgi:hypothetical protein
MSTMIFQSGLYGGREKDVAFLISQNVNMASSARIKVLLDVILMGLGLVYAAQTYFPISAHTQNTLQIQCV